MRLASLTLFAAALLAAAEPTEQAYLGHIKYLASDKLKGRGTGTPELEQAADYIAREFKAAGLKPE